MHIFLVLQLIALAVQLGFLFAQIRATDYDESMFYGRACQIGLVPVLLFAALFFATK
jgi:hypothetical protein